MFDNIDDHFDSEATDVLTEIGEVYADEFDAPVTILTASLGEGMIIGQLMSGGDIYNYAANGDEIGFDYSPEDSKEVNEYARGFLESGYGIKTDSMDNPYEYAFGFVRLDAQVKCKKGGVACGKICLPKGAQCKKYGGSGNGAAMKQAASKLKSPGGVAAGVAAGLAGTAALAGGAGYLAYKNRDKLGEPGRKLGVIGTRVKAAAKEGKEEFMSGVNSAKQILKTSEAVNKGLANTPPVEGVGRKEGYKLNTAKKMAQAGSRGAGLAGAAGAVVGGTENAINAVKYNLTRNPKFGSGGSGGSSSGGNALPPGKKGGAIDLASTPLNPYAINRKEKQKALKGSDGGNRLSGRSKGGDIELGRVNTTANLEERPKTALSGAGRKALTEGRRGLPGSSGSGRALTGSSESSRALPGSKVGQKLLKGRDQRALPPAREESFPIEATARAIVETNKAANKAKGSGKSFTQRKVEKSRKAKGK